MVHSRASDERFDATVQKTTVAETSAPNAEKDVHPDLAAGIAILGSDTTISSWNPQAAKITGYTLEQVQTLGLARIFDPPEVMQHILNKSGADLPTLSDYLQLRHADGHLLPVVVQCAPQRHIGETECQVVLVFKTLVPPEHRPREDEHLTVLGRLASSLSHEISNQLNAISLHTDVLDDEIRDLPAEFQNPLLEPVTDIRAESTRLHDLVEDFLSLARLTQLRREPEDLVAYLHSLSQTLEALLTPHGIALCLEDFDDLGEVALHRNTFRHLWLNLVHNAIDAMPHGGTLTIRGKRLASCVQLEISDTGSGVSSDQQPLLFLPFHTTKPDGTGLGLYVAQEIVSAHGGTITVSSPPEGGATFAVSLPLADANRTASV